MELFRNMESAAESNWERTERYMEQLDELMKRNEGSTNPSGFWSHMAESELNVNGESDAYRNYMEKANSSAAESSVELWQKAKTAREQGYDFEAEEYGLRSLKALIEDQKGEWKKDPNLVRMVALVDKRLMKL